MALHCSWSAYPWGNCSWEISRMNLCNPLLTCSIRLSIFSIHTKHLFLPYTCTCTLLEMTQPEGPKMFLIFMHLQWEEDHTHIHQLSWGLSSHRDRTAVTILSKKVSNDIKGKYAGPVPGDVLGGTQRWCSCGGPNWLFGQSHLKQVSTTITASKACTMCFLL